MDAYVLGTSNTFDFKLPEDEFHSNWTAEGMHTTHILWNSKNPADRTQKPRFYPKLNRAPSNY